MKHLAVGLALLIATAMTASAQRKDGTSMEPIIDRANKVVKILEKKKMEVVRIELDIVAGEKETQRMLYDQWTYGAIAVADERVDDLDIYVFKQVDGDWVQVKKDDSEDATPAVVLEPDATSLYKFVVRVHKYAGENTAAHYALVIYHE